MDELTRLGHVGAAGEITACGRQRFTGVKSTWTLTEITTAGAKRWPAAPALGDGARTLTFAQLHDEVSKVATVLRSCGIAPGERVAVWASKSVESVVTLLAVTAVGATFVPLDPQTPADRLEFLLADVNPTLIVVGIGQAVSAAAREVLERHDSLFLSDAQESNHSPTINTPIHVAPSDVAYILYTSGSTGKPKGVAIEHRQVEQFFRDHNARAGIGPGHRCLNTGSLYFDVFVLDILLPLWAGAFVRLGPALPIQSVILRILAEERITHVYAVGTVLALITGDGTMLDRYDLSSLRLLQTGAEVCNPGVVNQWLTRLPHLDFLNSYGPTEVTVGCVSYVHPRTSGLLFGDVPIGAPHAGTLIEVVAPGSIRRITEPGVVGELLLGGAQVMRGYFSRPIEEKRAFVTLFGERYYRTGDLEYRDANGQLYIRGRVDDEVKLNGHRVHPSELVSVLRACPDVVDATGGVITVGGVPKLVAVVVAPTSTDAAALVAQLQDQVRRALPPYMRPAHIALFTELPRTPTGKCDTRAALARLQDQLS